MIKTLITIFFFWLCFASCLQAKRVSDAKASLSLAQTQIQNLVDTFKLAVEQESSLDKRDSIRNKYAYKFYDLLSNIYIDSIRVHVDSATVDDLTVIMAFHCNNEISFRTSLTFLQKMDSKQDSLFRFMKGLKPGIDTMVNFDYMGYHQVRLPNSNGTPVIKIFAFPTPIWLTKIQTPVK